MFEATHLRLFQNILANSGFNSDTPETSTQKPLPLVPRYEPINPTLPGDQWDDSEPSNLDELNQQTAKQSAKELEKIAVRQDRWNVLFRVSALLVPVAISFAFLQLSWRHHYWHDSNENVGEQLALLQIAAKAHEILITLSLSDLVLHYLRQQLSSYSGLPFGLFASAYQVSLGAQPLSFGFLHSVKSMLRPRHVQW